MKKLPQMTFPRVRQPTIIEAAARRLPIYSQVMWIFDSLNSKPDEPGSGHAFPPTARF
jgi:hypothetical protein